MSPQEILEVPLLARLHNPALNFLKPVDIVAVCPAFKISDGEDPAKEIVERRTPISKIYQTGENEFKCLTNHSLIHYDHNGKLEEINLRIEDVDGKKRVTKAPYKIEIFTDRVGYHLDQPDGTHFTIELVAIGDAPVNNALLQSTVNDCQLFWDGMAPGISMKVLLIGERPEIFTQISDAFAPRSFTWKITQQGEFEFNSFGGDMNKDSLEVLVDRKDIDSRSFLYTEAWTGRVSRKDKKTRIKSWYNDPVYPVVIDPTVNINTTALVDNGYSGSSYGRHSATWIYTGAYIKMGGRNSGRHYNGGVRFRNVGIPARANIISAKLKVPLANPRGTSHADGITVNVYGDKVANAPLWSSSSLPFQITKTLHSTGFTPAYTQNGTISTFLVPIQSIGVTQQVASIVGLSGWASGNAMRFGLFTPQSVFYDNNYFFFYQFPHSPSTVLVITYGLPRNGDMNFMGI